MRGFLLALAAIAMTIPAAEAAQRDSQRAQASRQAKPAVTAQAPRQAAPARQVSTTRQAAPARQATTTRQAAPARQAAATRQGTATRQSANLRQAGTQRFAARPGDVRTSSSSMVVRGASAATISRDAMARQNRGVRGWQSGLMPTSHAQTQCPEGTFATLAAGHANVVRCMPF
jgi:hypothetical protein